MKRTISMIALCLLMLVGSTALADMPFTLSFSALPATAMYSTDDGATYHMLETGSNQIPGDPSRLKLKLVWDMDGKTEVLCTTTSATTGADLGWHVIITNETPYSVEYSCERPDGGRLDAAAFEFTLRNYPATESFTQDHIVWVGLGPVTFTVASGKTPTSYHIDDTLGFMAITGELSPTITIEEDVMNSLSPGEHLLRAYFRENNVLTCAEATLIIPDKGVPIGVDASGGRPQGQSSQTASGYGVVSGVPNWCNVRSGPSTTDEIIGTARAGSVLEILGREGKWVNVRFTDGKSGESNTGWVSHKFVLE